MPTPPENLPIVIKLLKEAVNAYPDYVEGLNYEAPIRCLMGGYKPDDQTRAVTLKSILEIYLDIAVKQKATNAGGMDLSPLLMGNQSVASPQPEPDKFKVDALDLASLRVDKLRKEIAYMITFMAELWALLDGKGLSKVQKLARLAVVTNFDKLFSLVRETYTATDELKNLANEMSNPESA